MRSKSNKDNNKASNGTFPDGMGEYVMSEIRSHLRHLKAVRDDIDETFGRIESESARIVAAPEGDVTRDDLVALRDLSRRSQMGNVELVKLSARLSLLVQLAESAGMAVTDDKDLGQSLRDVVSDPSSGFVFGLDEGRLVMRDKTMEEMMHRLSEREIPENGVKDEIEALRVQYADYVAMRERLSKGHKPGKDGEA